MCVVKGYWLDVRWQSWCCRWIMKVVLDLVRAADIFFCFFCCCFFPEQQWEGPMTFWFFPFPSSDLTRNTYFILTHSLGLLAFSAFISHLDLYLDVFNLGSLHLTHVKQITRGNDTNAHLIPPVFYITFNSCSVRDCTTHTSYSYYYLISYSPPELVVLC